MKQGVACQHAADARSSASGGLSTEVLEQAATRAGLVAGAFGGAALVGLLLDVIFYLILGWEPPPRYQVAMAMLGLHVALAVLVLAYSRVPSRCPRRALRLGMAYQLVGGLLLAVAPYWGDALLQDTANRLPWLGVWILIWPILVPGPLLRQAALALLLAALPPAVFLTWSLSEGQPLPAGSILLTTFLPCFFCAGLALVPARAIWRLGKSVSDAQREARQMGSYRMLEPLGKGGMGEVWRAEHRMLARPAAIKLIRPEALERESDEEARRAVLGRFEREAQSTAALRSPHTIGLYDFGTTDDGTFYYVMELLEGIDLEQLVQRFGPLPPARVVYLLEQACRSLAEAHEQGMVHRDIKPANLFVCRLGLECDFLKVLDFGLVASLRRLPAGEDVKLTGDGFIVGTPAYMAPEQAEGGQPEPRSDLYALGCVAFYALTGEMVFTQQSAIKMLMDHMKTSPQRPSQRLGRPIPPELEAIVMDCLAKLPLDRPASALELLRRLEALDLSDRWDSQAAGAWWRQHLPELRPASPELRDPGSPRPPPDPYADTVTLAT